MSAGLDKETIDLILGAIDEFAHQRLPEAKLLELDHKDEFPEEIIREMGGQGLGVQLLAAVSDRCRRTRHAAVPGIPWVRLNQSDGCPWEWTAFPNTTTG